VPSGYLADVIGRKRTLAVGAAFFPLGLAVYAAGRSLAAFVLAEFFLAGSVMFIVLSSGAALTGAIARHWHEGPSPFQG
jgi:MFS family permease